jgi:hypothetical protein
MENMNYRDLWEIYQGIFVPWRPEYTASNPYQLQAKTAGQLLIDQIQCEAVYLRGTGMHPHVDYQLEDLDLIVCYNSKTRDDVFPSEEEIESLLKEELPFHIDWDIRLHDLSHSFEEMNILTYFFLQLRSMFLVGTDYREIGLEIEADINTSIYLYNRAVDPLLPILDFYDYEEVSEFLPWLQKKTLRLLGFHALAQKGIFSRELSDCVRFGQSLYPELKDGFFDIHQDYLTGEGSKSYATMIVLQEILVRDIVTGEKVEEQEIVDDEQDETLAIEIIDERREGE